MEIMCPPGYHHNTNTGTWSPDVRSHVAGTNEPKKYQKCIIVHYVPSCRKAMW